MSKPHTELFTCPGGSQNSIGDPPTEPAIKPTGTLPPSALNMAVPVYQHNAENPCTVPSVPGVTAFHSGSDTHDEFVHGYLQFEPFQLAGSGNGVCTEATESIPLYLPAAVASAVPLSAEKH